MTTMNKVEDMVAGWLKPIPHLPTSAQKWIAENVWWITLVGVIISVFGIITLAGAILVAMSLFGAVTSYLYYAAPVYSGWWEIWSVISLLVLIVVTAVEAMAINPLKNMKKKGWDLLFLALVIGAADSVFNFLRDLSVVTFIPGIISIVIGTGIGAYLLIETRSYFKDGNKTAPVNPTTTTK